MNMKTNSMLLILLIAQVAFASASSNRSIDTNEYEEQTEQVQKQSYFTKVQKTLLGVGAAVCAATGLYYFCSQPFFAWLQNRAEQQNAKKAEYDRNENQCGWEAVNIWQFNQKESLNLLRTDDAFLKDLIFGMRRVDASEENQQKLSTLLTRVLQGSQEEQDKAYSEFLGCIATISTDNFYKALFARAIARNQLERNIALRNACHEFLKIEYSRGEEKGRVIINYSTFLSK
jgi:hypothetical protein